MWALLVFKDSRVISCQTDDLLEDNWCCKESVNHRDVYKGSISQQTRQACQPVHMKNWIIWLSVRLGCWDTVCFLYKGRVH